jgi:PKD repeat protein
VLVGQVVTFDSNRQEGEPDDNLLGQTHVSWDLDGDGQFGEQPGERVVQRRFDTPGTYQVSFMATNLVIESVFEAPYPYSGYDTKVIHVHAPKVDPGQNQIPTASFEPSPNPGYTERDITFDASGSQDPDGQVVQYEWDWTADGTYDDSGTSPTIAHKYDFAGAYTVRLRVTDDKGAVGTTERTVQVMDGVPPGKVIAREAGGVAAAGAGSPFSLEFGKLILTPGTTTVAGSKLLTAGIRAHGRISFKRAPALLGHHPSPRWAASLALTQKGNGVKAMLAGQGYILLALSKGNRLCLAGTASGNVSGGGIRARLAIAGGSGPSARLRGTGSVSRPVTQAGKRVLNGRLKLRKVRKARRLPKACRSLARTLP